MKRILIIYECRGSIFTSVKRPDNYNWADIGQLVSLLREYGYDVHALEYAEIDFNQDYGNTYIFYASAEDEGLFYKSYIEDLLLALSLRGATLIPAYIYLRSHHNKCMMELLRSNFRNTKLKTIRSRCFGTLGELEKSIASIEFPAVIKPSEGCCSYNISLVHSEEQLLRAAKSISKVIFSQTFRGTVRSILESVHYKKKSPILYPANRKKFIVQTYIKDLDGDYKVLVFADKYYVLKRSSRKGDFRASGSGLRTFPNKDDDISYVLDFAEMAYNELNVPFVSLDIGYDGKQCHLIEFQCTSFGPFTLEMSDHYYIHRNDGQWQVSEEVSRIEEEIARAIDYYIRKTHS